MTRTQLIHRAAQLEEILDNSDELSLPAIEEELCSIYKMLSGCDAAFKSYGTVLSISEGIPSGYTVEEFEALEWRPL